MLDAKELRYMQNTLPSEDNFVHLIGLFLCSLGIAVQDGITKTRFYAAERVWEMHMIFLRKYWKRMGSL